MRPIGGGVVGEDSFIYKGEVFSLRVDRSEAAVAARIQQLMARCKVNGPHASEEEDKQAWTTFARLFATGEIRYSDRERWDAISGDFDETDYMEMTQWLIEESRK